MARPVFFLYGVVAYLIFFATFLYLIAFVGDIPGVPRTVDRGPGGSVGTALAVDLALIALFGLQHSIMARQGFKAGWKKIVPEPVERSTYVVFASLALIVMFLFWRPIPTVIWQVEGIGATILWTLFAAGWAIVLLTTPAPAYSPEIEARGGDALFQANTAPAAGQVREEYARSGQWLKQP